LATPGPYSCRSSTSTSARRGHVNADAQRRRTKVEVSRLAKLKSQTAILRKDDLQDLAIDKVWPSTILALFRNFFFTTG
jgi:hypothetical protein